MRLAYVCLDPGVPVFGRKGSSIHCQEVMRAFIKRGYEVELFAKRLGDDVPDDLANIKTTRLGSKLPADAAAREKALTSLNFNVLDALKDADEFDLIYERYSLWSFGGMKFARHHGIPGVLEVNSPLIQEQKNYRTLIDEASAKTIRGECFKHATKIVAVSNEVADLIRKNYFAKDKTVSISNGVNCEKFVRLEQASSYEQQDELVVGFVGTLKPWHGVSNLLEAFSRARLEIPNLILKIVGDGPERQVLEEQLNRYPAEVGQSVKWLGAIPNSQIPEVLSTFHIAVAPYPDIPGFYFSPLKVLEYMAGGLPVIASRIGQIPSLVRHNQHGLLVKPGCERELKQSISYLCSDQDLRTRLGRTAQKYVQDNHTWHHVVDRVLTSLPASVAACEAC